MNVCFFIGKLTEGGIGRVASIIVNYLSKKNDISISALLYSKPEKQEIYKLEKTVPKEYLLEKHTSMKAAIIHEGLISKIRYYLKNNRIDIIVACGDMYFPAAILACCGRVKTKVICWNHTSPWISSDQSFQLLSRKFGMHFSDCNLVLTRSALRYYQSKTKNMSVQIYNPIDPNMDCTNSYCLESKKIMSVGRLCYQKNFGRLIDIAHTVLKNYPEWTWDIYGDGDEYQELNRKIKRLGLEKRICLKGNISDIYSKYREYAFIVMTSRYEGFPMTLLEASANALPLISFDIETGPNEIIKNNFNGFLCNSNDDNEMICSISKLIESSELRKIMSKNSHSESYRFSIERVIEEWIKLFNSIVT